MTVYQSAWRNIPKHPKLNHNTAFPFCCVGEYSAFGRMISDVIAQNVCNADSHWRWSSILRSHSLRVVNKTSLKMPLIACVDCYRWACYANTSGRKIQRPVKTENVENWLSALWIVSCSEKWRSSAIMIERKWRGKCSFLCWFYVQVFYSDIFRRSRQYRFLLNSCII